MRAHTAPGVLVQNPEMSARVRDLVLAASTVEIIRPYHGVTVHGDMSGDLGAVYAGDTPRPDLTIVTAAAVLLSAGRQVTVRDENAYAHPVPGDMTPQLRLLKLQLATWQADLATVADMRALEPDIPVVVFGGTVANLPADAVGDSIVGDAPSALAGLFDVADVTLIDGYRLLPMERYRTQDGTLRAHLQASRGCDRTCLYCPYIRTLGRWSKRSLNSFRQDVEGLRDLGVTEIQFRDQDFASDTAHAISVAEVMRDAGRGSIRWSVEGNLDQFTPELLDAMREGGATEAIVGIETVDPAVLRHARRKVVQDTAERLEQVVRHGLRARGLFLFGLPEDSWERARATLDFALGLPIHAAQFNVYSPLPGESFGLDRVATVDDFLPLKNDFRYRTCEAMTQKEVRLAAALAARIFDADRAGELSTRDRLMSRFAAPRP
ncbi:MAG TPA: radical SAM protein [Pseudonocardiaceae bacterium]|nr:radical SAM protein [Pseudonocardiaceae bacterium]